MEPLGFILGSLLSQVAMVGVGKERVLKKQRRRYDHQSLYEERQYGLYWYDWLWKIARPALIVAGAALIIAGVLLTGWNALGEKFFWPVDENDTTPVNFVVESGSSLTTVTNNLEEQGLIRNRSVLKYLMDFQGMSQKVQTGEYTLSKNMTVNEIIEKLTSGDGNPLTSRITIIPGWTVEDIADYLVKLGVAENKEAFYAACNDKETYGKYYYIDEVLQSGKAGQRTYLLEGYLAPDTYEIYNTATLDNVIQKLISQTEVVFNAEFHAKAEELGMTMDEIITLASMIEKEAKKDDFARVSAVFHNRLKTGMKLQSDVTVQYFTHSQKMALTDTQLSVSSPYNTYENAGLPIGPICNPSKDAIRAALYPDESFIAEQYLYFCSMDPREGTLYFSKTLEQHNEAVRLYRPLWIEYDNERGV